MRRITPLSRILAVLFGTAACFAVPLLHLGQTAGMDWHYFASLSLLGRSSVLQFHGIPLHDPWSGGGLDYLSNPQTRVFTPLFLLDLVLPPYLSDLASLLVYAAGGLWGMYLLLRRLNHGAPVAALCAFLFVNCGWFALHFAEGHIAYGPRQLLPWVLLFLIRFHSENSRFGLAALLAFFILGGGVYAAIYSALLVAVTCATDRVGVSRFLPSPELKNWLRMGFALLGAVLVAAPKWIPVIYLNGDLPLQSDLSTLSLIETIRVLFHPVQSTADVLSFGSSWRFHEFGAYLGVPGTLLIGLSLRSMNFVRSRLWALVGFTFFFWIGSGWGGVINPWALLHRLPFIGIAHIQSRLFVLMSLYFFILLAGALERLPKKRGLTLFAFGLLLAESIGVRAHVFEVAYTGPSSGPRPFPSLITSTTVATTVGYGSRPWHYFEGNKGAHTVHEPSAGRSGVRVQGDQDYRGEAYLTAGAGEVSLERFTPGRILLRYTASAPVSVEINSNYLGGWKSGTPGVEPYETDRGLVAANLPSGSGTVELLYRPVYLYPMIACFMAGILIWLRLLRRTQGSKEDPRPENNQLATVTDTTGVSTE